jgi:hypothetical protein
MMRKNGIQPENIPLKALNKTDYQSGLKETVTLRLKILFCGTVSRNDHRFADFFGTLLLLYFLTTSQTFALC